MNRRITDAGVAGLPVAEGRAELLEEIMATTPLETARPVDDPRPPRRSHWLPAVGAAAAVLAVAVGGVWLSNRTPAEQRTVDLGSAPGAGEIAVLDAPGWTLGNASVDEYGGELSYESDDQDIDATPHNDWGVTLEINWRPANTYDSYVADRDDVGPREEVTLLGESSLMWTYSRDDHTVIRPVVGAFTLEVRGSGMDEAAFRDLLGQLTAIAPADLDDHLPDEFVTDAERADVIAEMLDPIPLPTGFDRAGLQSDEIDRYQLGADVTGAVTCAWIDRFREARRAGDEAAVREAQDALATARDWPTLQEMAPQGGWSDVVWELADQIAAGKVPEGYAEGLGCDG